MTSVLTKVRQWHGRVSPGLLPATPTPRMHLSSLLAAATTLSDYTLQCTQWYFRLRLRLNEIQMVCPASDWKFRQAGKLSKPHLFVVNLCQSELYTKCSYSNIQTEENLLMYLSRPRIKESWAENMTFNGVQKFLKQISNLTLMCLEKLPKIILLKSIL